ncbi:MAG: S8 family serine peptidase [Candidatus Methanodesulfokora washburnensis]|jgi:subtilisin family serine protease
MRRLLSFLLVLVLLIPSLSVVGEPYKIYSANQLSGSLVGKDMSKYSISRTAMNLTTGNFQVAVFLKDKKSITALSSALSEKGEKKLSSMVSTSRVVETKDGKYMIKVIAEAKKLPILDEMKEKGIILDYKVKSRPDMPNITALMGDKEEIKKIAVDMIAAREVIRAREVNSMGYTGSGITVAVVDTGVDYSNPDLRDTLKYYVGSYYQPLDGVNVNVREPLVLDADEAQVLTTVDVKPNATGYIDLSGVTVVTYRPWYEPLDVSNTTGNTTAYVGNIPSKSGHYKFGIAYFYVLDPMGVEIYYAYNVLMADPVTAENYTLVVIDWNKNSNFNDEYSSGLYYTYDGERITYYDANGNGDYDAGDVSLGVVGGFFYDVGWNFGYPGYFFPGWDLKGRYLSFFYDFYSHGTMCAGTVASRGTWSGLPGIAPEAKIIGIKGLWIGDVEIGMLWAAGFDVDQAGNIYYTGSPRADIISNSWGNSLFFYDAFGFGYDFESMFENGLTTPGFLDPNFPGIPIVHAAGNGGPGYGTVTAPGTASAVITVGASTSFMTYPGGRFYDDIISWSARGPSPLAEAKPDVVNIGAWAWTVAPHYYGGYDIFGGTSMATPMTAGVIALMLQANPSLKGKPALIRSMIQSTAVDLKYDPFKQGSGRVDALNAVSLALRMAGTEPGTDKTVLIKTSTSSTKLKEMLSGAWEAQWGINIPIYMWWWYGNLLPSVELNLTKLDFANPSGSLYLGIVGRRDVVPFSFSVTNPTSTGLSFTARAVTYVPTGAPKTYSGLLDYVPGWRFIKWYIFDPSEFEGAELTKFSAAIDYSSFDYNNNYVRDLAPRLYIWYWDGTGTPTPYVNAFPIDYDYATGTTEEVVVHDIAERVKALGPNYKIAVYVRAVNYASLSKVPFILRITNYKRVTDTSVKLSPSSGSIAPGGTVTITGKLIASTVVGPQQGYIELDFGSFKKYIPYTYGVYLPLYSVQYLTYTSPTDMLLYNPSSLNGAFDWSWRYESGDWRVYYVKLMNPAARGLFVDFKWTQDNSTLAIYTLNSIGMFAGGYWGTGVSRHGYLGDGIFNISSITDAAGKWKKEMIATPEINNLFWVLLYPWVLSPPKIPITYAIAYQQTGPGYYTIIVHQLAHGGKMIYEPIKGYVSVLSPYDLKRYMNPCNITMKKGETRPADFSWKLWAKADVTYWGESAEIDAYYAPPLQITPDYWYTTSTLNKGYILNAYKDAGMVISATDTGDGIAGVLFITFHPDYKLFYKYMGTLYEDSYSTMWFEEDLCPVHVPS